MRHVLCSCPSFIAPVLLHLQLARSYVDAINGGGMPSIADAWESAAAVQCGRSLAGAWDAYGAAIRESVSLPMNEMELNSAHEKALMRAVALFDAGAPSGAEAAVEKHRAQLHARTLEAFASTKVSYVTRTRKPRT